MKIKDFLKRSSHRLALGKKANFIIIGVQKGGTTALHHYLSVHPSLVPSYKKELHYFDSSERQAKENYMMNFPFVPIYSSKKVYETTPSYIFYPSALKAIHRFNPHIKLIVTLREPVSRAFSAWNMYHNTFSPNNPKAKNVDFLKSIFDPRTFEEAIDEEFKLLKNNELNLADKNYLKRGCYIEQLEYLTTLFKPKQLLVLHQEDMKEDLLQTMQKVESFLELPKHNWDKILQNKDKYKSYYVEKINNHTLSLLKSYYQPYNKALEKFLNQKLNWD